MNLGKNISAYLNRLPIAKKVQSIYVPPAIIIAVFVAAFLISDIRQISNANKIKDFIQLALTLDGVAHNFAVERGLTAGFLGSKGQKGQEKVAKQREKANAAKSKFLTYIEEQGSNIPAEIKPQLSSLTQQLQKIDTLRKQVNNLDTSGNPFLTYSTINKTALDTISYLTLLITDHKVINQLEKLNALLWLKERAGQERGALNGVFASGKFNASKISAIKVYYADQQTKMDAIKRYMSTEEFKAFNAKLEDENGRSVSKFRDAFLQAVKTGETTINANSADWFAAATGRIKNIKGTADTTAEAIASKANTLIVSAWVKLVTTLSLSLLAGGALHYFSMLIISQLTQNIQKITNGLNKVAREKQFANQIQVNSQDELSEAAGAFNQLMTQLQLAIEDVNTVMSNVAKGDFASRIQKSYEGDLQQLKLSVNHSAEKVETTMSALEDVMEALERGDFSARMSNNIEGKFKRKVDSAMEKTESAMTEVATTMAKMSEGDFSHRITLPLNGTLEDLKQGVNSSMQSIENAIKDISKAVLEQKNGNFSWKITNEYQGDINTLTVTINDSMSSIDNAIQQISEVITHFRYGELSHRIQSELPGDLGTMKNSINSSLDELNNAINEIVSVASSQRNGELNAKIVGSYRGELNVLKGTLNDTGATIENIVTQISETMGCVQKGDFSQRLNYEAGGSFAELKQMINASLESLQGAISDITTITNAQTSGELFKKMRGDHKGELQNISNSVNKTMDTLSNIVQEIQVSSEQTTNMSKEQSMAITDMARRTEAQASSLEEISSNMSSIRDNVENTENDCQAMAGIIQEINMKTEKTVDILSKTVSSMTDMRTSSQEISKITNLIDEIAFQTNLLALNAAVEAARAGETGRGFAVVAGEVRNLAQRSADAAKGIKELISEMLENVENSFNMGQQSNEDIKGIVSHVLQSSDMMHKVQQAASQQSQSIHEVFSAIGALDNMTQENAAMVEQTTAASRSIEEQIRNVHGKLQFFKLRQA